MYMFVIYVTYYIHVTRVAVKNENSLFVKLFTIFFFFFWFHQFKNIKQYYIAYFFSYFLISRKVTTDENMG